MKKSPVKTTTERIAILLTVLGLAGLFSAQSRAALTLNIGAGQLSDSTGLAIPQDSGLVLLVASTGDFVFSAPTPGSFVNGDDVELGRWNVNLDAGLFSASYVGSPEPAGANWSVGDMLILYWYPSLTTASLSPSAGDRYGAFRTDSPNEDEGIAWITPASEGGLYDLTFVTASQGGTRLDTEGYATYQVTAVPEPITCALAVFGAFFAGSRALRWHAARRSR